MDWFSFPQIVGYIAYVSSFYACAQKDDNRLFKYFGCSWLLFGLHHFLMGNDAAAVSAVLIGIRMFTSIYWKGAVIAYPFSVLALVMGYFTYASPLSLLPLGAVIVATFGAAYFSGVSLRLIFISTNVLWFVHNAAVGSIGAMAFDITIAVSHGLTAWRIHLDRKKEKAPETVSEMPEAA